ncbi:hypothetical protein C2S51_008310 [Perilla frutescens var. frutescens]|nr:hypothetical protein C2S51_008310 [Perilla frutescens var. frutescens]
MLLIVAKPGCQARCGNLAIPYPFGVGSNCYLEPSFDISCDNSTVPPRAYLSIMNKEVFEINQTYIRIITPFLISACYESEIGMNVTGDRSYEHTTMSVNLSGTPYTLSGMNWLTTIGCDDMVLQSNGSSVSGGCSVFCGEKNDAGGVGYSAFCEIFFMNPVIFSTLKEMDAVSQQFISVSHRDQNRNHIGLLK